MKAARWVPLAAAAMLAASLAVAAAPGETTATVTDSPAHRAARRFMRGANLGNCLEAPPAQDWGATYTPADFDHIRAEGFDHVRIPVAWHHHTGPAPDFALSPAIVARVDAMVSAALERNLAVIVNVHHFDDFTSDPAALTPKLIALWRQIATHYASAPDSLAFELINEPKDAAATERLGPLYARTIAEIRKTNPRRTVFVGPGHWNAIAELDKLALPPGDNNLIVTVHCYEPFLFTHQGATWAGPDTKTTGIVFPGPPATPLAPDARRKTSPWVGDWIRRYNTEPGTKNPCGPQAFTGLLRQARQWSEKTGRPVHVGEFGAFDKADPSSRARYYGDFRRACDANGLGWAVWDWKAGFRYWDPAAARPMPGMREALFGRATQDPR